VTPQINAISTVLLAATLLFVFASERLASGRMSTRYVWPAVIGLGLLGVFAFGGQGRSAKGGELNLFIWSNYIPDSVVAEFEHRYEAKVNIELYDSNEALLAKLQSGGARYDLIVPSDYMVSIMREQGLLQEIDRNRITNFSNLDPQFVAPPFDPDNRHSIAYLWGTTGIGYRKDKVSGDAWIVQGYNGQIAKAMEENPNIAYVVPKEGCTVSLDNLCIPRNAANPDLAHEFINFILEAGAAADIANLTGYSSPNLAARPLIKKELLTNEAIYPSRQVLERCEFIKEIGETINLYDRLWTEIKSK